MTSLCYETHIEFHWDIILAPQPYLNPELRMQQMQVTVPAGVGPGMAFIVNTPAGQIQVTCPPDAKEGMPMLVNVPVATPQPMMVATAQPGHPAAMAAPQMAVEEPIVMGIALPESAPQPMQMSDTEIEMSRLLEANLDGWYGLQGCPTCCCMRIAFNEDKSAFTQGPCCCWQIPIPCVVPNAFKAKSPGSTTFTDGNGEEYIWKTPTKFHQPSWNNDYVKWC